MVAGKVLSVFGYAASGLEYIVNAVPKIGGAVGGVIGGKPGKVIGTSLGYVGEVAAVSVFVPVVGGTAAVAVAVASPVLGAYKYARNYINSKKQ